MQSSKEIISKEERNVAQKAQDLKDLEVLFESWKIEKNYLLHLSSGKTDKQKLKKYISVSS